MVQPLEIRLIKVSFGKSKKYSIRKFYNFWSKKSLPLVKSSSICRVAVKNIGYLTMVSLKNGQNWDKFGPGSFDLE